MVISFCRNDVPQTMFASKTKGREKDGSTTIFFDNLFPTMGQLGMCVDRNEAKYEVKVREALPDEETMYWGWEDNNGGHISMIYPKMFLFNMCFPNGYEAEEELGEGRRIRVIIEK